uniref:Centriolar coiled-coil protein of 110 kDa n=1 Tax=Heliothis virescens TaxID=7102 RepID=A0A2A4K6Q2_HELVI
MNDPWDVKCVRRAGQYVSCMKINGVPLLPPVLSKECRKEMQYYKLLAREVEKRITLLQPYVMDTDSESEDKTDAPELPECEQSYDLPHEEGPPGFNVNIDKITAMTSAQNDEKAITSSPEYPVTNICNNITSNVVVESIDSGSRANSPKFIIDLSLSINETGNNVIETVKRTPHSPPQIDLPERDYNCMKRRITQKVITEKEVITEVDSERNNKKQKAKAKEIADYNFSHNKNKLNDPFADVPLFQDGPSSLSSKSFTGSLTDLHRESIKDLHIAPKLIRQRSYTILNPSPQLIAHLKVQSKNTGIEMNSISMSESYSNLSSPNKKRRSWDLETAKVKWSSMALELKQTNVVNTLSRKPSNRTVVRNQPVKKSPLTPPPARPKTFTVDKTRRNIVTPKPMIRSNAIPCTEAVPKSEPIPRNKKSISPVRNTSNRPVIKDPGSPKAIRKQPEPLSQSHAPAPSICEAEDPGARVRELYEKIQNQQLLQMATLVEKQKKEQLLLQQVFEEQNNLLFKQLKTICPKSPIEVKEAWGDKHLDADRGPVSLSQLINLKSPERSDFSSPVSATLTETNNYINHCDNVLKKSRDITGSIKKQPNKPRFQTGAKIVPPKAQPEASKTRAHSPSQRNTPTSRRLNYDTSASSDQELEPMLTDRTNDTMADLNVTFPSDNDDYSQHNNSGMSHVLGKEIKTIHGASHTSSAIRSSRSTDNAIRNMERTIHNSINSTNSRVAKAKFNIQGTPEERAAATKIVAVAKGYLVRRLMRTDRVQATVQTIKDALLCALQLHQDREGIRGADVDLHRRLIQQITAACYSLHDTFVASTASERCAMIAADRGRRRSVAARQANNSFRQTDLMSQSHTGAFPARTKRPPPSLMSQSYYETFSDEKRASVSRQLSSPNRRPWR